MRIGANDAEIIRVDEIQVFTCTNQQRRSRPFHLDNRSECSVIPASDLLAVQIPFADRAIKTASDDCAIIGMPDQLCDRTGMPDQAGVLIALRRMPDLPTPARIEIRNRRGCQPCPIWRERNLIKARIAAAPANYLPLMLIAIEYGFTNPAGKLIPTALIFSSK